MNNNRIKFSLIITVYNIEKHIEKCINSILKQTYTNYEVIIVNDGSTDNSQKAIEKYNNDKIRIIKQDNKGVSEARNIGLKYVTGEYIWFIDGDDYIEQNALEILYNNLQENLYDIIDFAYYKRHKTKMYIHNLKSNLLDSKQYILLVHTPWSKIFKTTFFLSNNFKFAKGKIYEDLALVPFILTQTNNIKFINDTLYNYIYRKNSIVNNITFTERKDDKFWAIDSLYSSFKNKHIDKHYESELEFIAIYALAFSYTYDILQFSKKIYIPRCEKVLNYLNDLNSNWPKNKYLQASKLITKIYFYFFIHKHYYICKGIVLFAKSIGRL